PQQVERFDRLGDPPQSLGLVVEVEIDEEAHAGPGALTQRGELGNQRVEDVVGEIELGMADAGTGHARGELPTTLVVEQQQVGLERLEAALARLAGGAREIIEAAHRWPVDHLAVEQISATPAQHAGATPIDRHPLASGAAARARDRHPIAQRAAEQLVDRNAECLALDVEAGIHDRGDGVGCEPARRRPRLGVQRRADATDLARIPTDERGAEALDYAGHAPAAALVELGPTSDALVGGDLQERIGVPTAVDMEVLELHDLHWMFPRPGSGVPVALTRPRKLCHGSPA